MTIKTNNAEGGTDAVVVTTGNSGGASGDAFNSVTASPTTEDAPVLVGTMAYAFAAANTKVTWTGFASTLAVARIGFRLTVNTGLNGLRLLDIRTNSQMVGRVLFNTSNYLYLQSGPNVNVASLGTFVPSIDTLYVVELAAQSSNGADATVKAQVYAADDPGTILGTASTTTASQGTTANITTIDVGRAATDTYSGIVYVDEIYAEDGTLTYPGIWATPITETLTDNQAFLEATDGTPPFTIAQDSGTATTPTELDDGSVSGTGQWLVTKHASDTLVYTVTDDAAVTSDPYTVDPISSTQLKRPTPSTAPGTTWV